MIPGMGMPRPANAPTLSLPEIPPNVVAMIRRFGPIVFVSLLVFFYLPSAWHFYFRGGLDSQRAFSNKHNLDFTGPLKSIDRLAFESLLKEAQKHPSGRLSYNISASTDPIQRHLVVWAKGSYKRPSKLTTSKTGVVLEGFLAFATFDNEGKFENCKIAGPNLQDAAVDIAPGVWFTTLPVSAMGAVELDITGPPTAGAEAMPGAPEEGSPLVDKFLEDTLQACLRRVH